MNKITKYILILVLAIITGGLVGWFITSYLGITDTVALNTIRVTWVLGVLIGYLAGRKL